MASEEKTRCQLNSILELEIVNQEPHLYSRICIPEGTILGVVTDAAGNVNHQVLAFARMMRIEEQEMSCTPGNVVARQVDGQLFYQTSTTINKGVELSVCSEGAHAITSLLAAASSNGHIGEENTDVFKLLKRQSDSGQPSTATSESESASRTHQMIIPTSTGPGWSGVAEDSDGEEIWCEHCGADFVHHSDLHRHECPEAVSVSDHESGGLHVCRDCDKAFATSSGLKQHAHIHATVKPYVCEVCNKSYTQFSNLCRHKRIHSDCRLPVQCNGCSQKFVSTTALGKHRRFCGVKSPTDLQTADKAGNSMSFAEFGRLLPEQHQAILLAQLAASRSHSARNLFHPYLMHPLNARGLLPMSHSPESGRSLLKVAAKIESDGEGSPRSSDASDRKYLSDRSRDSCSPQPHTTTQNISGDVSPVPESLVSEVQSRREDFDDSRLHRHISSLDEGTTHHNIDGCVEISGAPLDLRISAKKTATETAPAESSTSPRSSPQPTRVGSASPVGPPASAFSNLPPSATAAANLCLNFNINHWLNLSRLLPSATLARLPFLSHPGLLAPQLDKGMQSFSGSPTATQTFLSSQANGPGVLLPNQFGVTPNSGRPPVSSKAKDRYACRYCGKIFPRSANLTRHLRTHTGEQPYKCQYCERSFSISSNLQRHVRNIHNKEKPYKCHLCDRCFGQQTNLDRHLKKHDSDPAESSGVSLQMEKPDSSAQTPPLLHSDDALPSAGSEDIITACKFAEQLQSLL